jgi:hypothetical protein
VRGDAAEHRDLVDVLRQGRLDENAVDGGVGVELVDQGEELGLGDGDGREEWIRLSDADFGGGLLLFA